MGKVKSFCRTCIAGCGVVLDLDDTGHIASMAGDPDHPVSEGYVCFKGLQGAGSHHGEARLLHSCKRTATGFEPIPSESAFDEIAARLRLILDRDGPEAIGLFRGTGAFHSANAFAMHGSFLSALGSTSLFTTLTIDQSAKMVAAGRLGSWHAGKCHIDECDVALVIGNNPLVSHSAGEFLLSAPVKRLKRARQRGMKLIVMDPRRTETARYADLFIQPRPGEDAAIAAGLLHLLFETGAYDRQFCEQYVEGLDALRAAVAPFTPDYVSARAGIAEADLRRAAQLFGAAGKRGIVITGTGPNMAPHSNLAEHLAQCIPVVCGCFKREGDRLPNYDPLLPASDRFAEVVPPTRPWDDHPPSRIRGVGNLFGEKLTATLADEILTPGPGQIKALIVDGANIANSVPDKSRMLEALRSLELLVVIDPHLTPTARLAHYVVAPTLQYERPDLPITLGMPLWSDTWTQYTPAIVSPPAGSDVVDGWYVFWALARRLGLALEHGGERLDMETAPTGEDLLRAGLRNAAVSLDDIQRQPNQIFLDPEGLIVKPARPGATGHFAVAPPDVREELASVLGEDSTDDKHFEFRLIARRMRDLNGSIGAQTATVRGRHPYNPLQMHPLDLARLGLGEGDWIQMTSESGHLVAIVASDDTMRPGVVSMTHNWGAHDNTMASYRLHGGSTNFLTRTDVVYESINAMPRMTAIPVRVEPADTRPARG